MIWPFIMGLAAIMAVLAFAAGKRADALALLVILTALVAVRAKNAVFLDYADLRVALGALVWSTAAVALVSRRYTIQGGILAFVALCSLWAQLVEARPVIGSLPYVTADALVVLATAWIGRDGVLTIAGNVADLARRSDRRGHRAARVRSAGDN